MNKTILYPTDFTLESLKPLQAFLQFQATTPKNVILVHAIHLTDSITELLFYNKQEQVLAIAGAEFLEEIKQLETSMPEILASIRVELFTGFSQSGFNTFCTAHKVEKIVFPNGFNYQWKHKRSLNILPYIEKSSFEKTIISYNFQRFDSEFQQIIPSKA